MNGLRNLNWTAILPTGALLLLGFGKCLVAEDVQFNRDIRPILSENCFQCHGPDAKHREADLRLDQRESAVAPRDHGAAITPGNIAASELVKRILSTDEDVTMPPAK